MSLIEAIIFGIVQGISEFLPISSTAHLIIAQLLLGYELPGFGFEVFLHIASLLAVLIYYRSDLYIIIKDSFSFLATKSPKYKNNFYFSLYILIATIITGGLGVMLEDTISNFMKAPIFIAISLLITGVFLIFIEKFFKYGTRTEKQMNLIDAIVVGLAQTLAIIPGISRSGSTLVTGLFMGLNRETAVRFSFLLSIPVIAGSSLLTINDLVSGSLVEQIGILGLSISFISAFIFSWIGIFWLIEFLKRSKLIYFAGYCFLLSFVLIFL